MNWIGLACVEKQPLNKSSPPGQLRKVHSNPPCLVFGEHGLTADRRPGPSSNKNSKKIAVTSFLWEPDR